MKRKLLILDLDETLIHGDPDAGGGDFFAAGIPVFVRPGAREFLARMAALFDLAVWTSASSDYADEIVRQIFPDPPEFVWSRDRCVRQFDPDTHTVNYLKDLKKVRRRGRDLAEVIVVDDSPEKLARNYGNLVRVPPFTGGEDNVLEHLSDYLASFSDVADVRLLEKRGWLTGWRRTNGVSA